MQDRFGVLRQLGGSNRYYCNKGLCVMRATRNRLFTTIACMQWGYGHSLRARITTTQVTKFDGFAIHLRLCFPHPQSSWRYLVTPETPPVNSSSGIFQGRGCEDAGLSLQHHAGRNASNAYGSCPISFIPHVIVELYQCPTLPLFLCPESERM